MIKTKFKSCNFIVDMEVYPFDVMVSCGETDNALQIKLRTLGVDEEKDLWVLEQNTVQGRYCRFKNGAFLIRLRNFPTTPNHFGDLSHEIFHVVNVLLELNIGMKLRFGKNDEAYAYLIGYLTKKIYEKLKIK